MRGDVALPFSPQRVGLRRRRSTAWTLVVAGLAQFMVILNATIVVVALPSMQHDLSLSDQTLAWVINAYILTFGGFLILGGRVGDLYGRRRILLLGILLFTAASLFGAVSGSSGTLLAARAVQGLGAAAVMPSTFAIVIIAFPDGPRRRRALSIWSAVSSVAVCVAIVVGGLLINTLSWHAVFLVNIPLGLTAAVATALLVEPPQANAPGHLDIAGALTITAASMATTYALIESAVRGWRTVITLGSLGIAALLCAAFVFIESRHQAPLVRLSVFAKREFSIAVAVVAVMSGTTIAVSVMITLFLQDVLGYSPLLTGLSYLPFTIVLGTAALTTHLLLHRVGIRVVLFGAMSLLTVGVLLLTRITPESSYSWTVLPAMTAVYIGVGLSGVTLTILATLNLAENETGTVSGLMATSHEVGGGAWFAAFSAVAAAGAAASAHAADDPISAVSGYRTALWVMAAVLAVTAVASLTLLRPADDTVRHVGEESPDS